MLTGHVMYGDILHERMYIDYKYYDKFDIEDKKCLYCYRNNEREIRHVIDTTVSAEYVQKNVIDALKEIVELTPENEIRLLNLLSGKNPCVRLAVYAGANINKAKVFDDFEKTGDIKRVFIELTGEINAVAMDGLFSLYASALYYLEGKEDTPNAKIIKENYKKLISGSYIYMKRGTAMEFFFMPISDIEKAAKEHDVNLLMESVNNFTDVYIRNNAISHENNDI